MIHKKKPKKKGKLNIEFTERVHVESLTGPNAVTPRKFSLDTPTVKSLSKLPIVQAFINYPGFKRLLRSKLKFQDKYLILSESYTGYVVVAGYSNSKLDLPVYQYRYEGG